MISMASRLARARSCRAHNVAESNLHICPLAIFAVRSAMSFVFHNSVRVIEPAPLICFSRNRRCPRHLCAASLSSGPVSSDTVICVAR